MTKSPAAKLYQFKIFQADKVQVVLLLTMICETDIKLRTFIPSFWKLTQHLHKLSQFKCELLRTVLALYLLSEKQRLHIMWNNNFLWNHALYKINPKGREFGFKTNEKKKQARNGPNVKRVKKLNHAISTTTKHALLWTNLLIFTYKSLLNSKPIFKSNGSLKNNYKILHITTKRTYSFLYIENYRDMPKIKLFKPLNYKFLVQKQSFCIH